MAAKPIKMLELHCPIIHFLIIGYILKAGKNKQLEFHRFKELQTAINPAVIWPVLNFFFFFFFVAHSEL